MRIDKIIKQKRQERGFTQEQLATCLNITAPAVNKWENGHAYPDITLLPSLARALKIDLNTLLSFKGDLLETEVYSLVAKLSEVFVRKGFTLGYEQVQETLREYSANELLILHCGIMLHGIALSMYPEENTEELQTEIKIMLERVLVSENQDIRTQAVNILILILISKEEFDEAEKLLKTLSDVGDNNKPVMLMNLYMKKKDYKQALEICESYILAKVGQVMPVLLNLEEIAIKEERLEDAREIATRVKETSVALELGEYYENTPLFLYAVAMKDKEKTLSTLRAMKEGMRTWFDYEKTIIYKHLPSQNFRSEEDNVVMMDMMLKSLVQENDLDFIKDEKEYKEIFLKME
jgi:Predicted transcription factor, homolog of eukaryotic MBF1